MFRDLMAGQICEQIIIAWAAGDPVPVPFAVLAGLEQMRRLVDSHAGIPSFAAGGASVTVAIRT